METTYRGFCLSVGCRKADPEDFMWDVAWVVGQRRLEGVDLGQVEEEAPTPRHQQKSMPLLLLTPGTLPTLLWVK